MSKFVCCSCEHVFDGKPAYLIPNAKRVIVSVGRLVQHAKIWGVELEKAEASKILDYMGGHDYALTIDENKQLFRHDWQDGHDYSKDVEYSLHEAVRFADEMSCELIDQECGKTVPNIQYISALKHDHSLLGAVQRKLDATTPKVCTHCESENCIGRSFANEQLTMQTFYSTDTENFLRIMRGSHNKYDYVATILDLGWAHFAERAGWSVVYNEVDKLVSLRNHSPAGEDLVFEFSCDGAWGSFVSGLKDAYHDFDPDDHAEEWVVARHNGSSGIPTIRELVEDAVEIDKMLEELYEYVCDFYAYVRDYDKE